MATTLGKRALITGITGQDGSYLAELLLERGYEVHGLVRSLSGGNFERLQQSRDLVTLHEGDLLDQDSLIAVMRKCEPEEVYNLAAMSVAAASWDRAIATAEFSALGVTRMLEAICEAAPQARFFQASSSEIFGRSSESSQDELTPVRPRSPYGVAKAYGHFITADYREGRDVFACSGVLFNHESPRRGSEFVTRKVTQGVAAIKLGLATELRLGNLDARRDWGFAPDYVEAMWLMLQQDRPEDFVLGTGEAHSVKDLVDIAFSHVGLDPADHVTQDPAFMRPSEVSLRVADSTKAYEQLGWRHTIDFDQLVRQMVDADLARLTAEARQGQAR